MNKTIKKKLNKKIDNKYTKIFIDLINIKCKPKRKTIYSTIYYLYHIILVLTDIQRWDALQLITSNKNKYHYKTIQDMHLKWSKLNIYKEAYNIFLTKYKLNQTKGSAVLTLFIDTSNIYNKNGCA